MAETVNITRRIYSKNTFPSVVDTGFKELLPIQEPTKEEVSVEKFFNMYDELFFTIPVSGPNSHEELLDRSGDYVGQTYSSLLTEVEQLKKENADLKNKIDSLIG